MSKKKRKLRGTVQQVIKSPFSAVPEKAQFGVEEADDLYGEIRIENVVTDEIGKQARLRQGAKVDVVVEADSDATQQRSPIKRRSASTSAVDPRTRFRS